jgi:hypothetical protein
MTSNQPLHSQSIGSTRPMTTDDPMIVFVIEINGRSILAFNADSQLDVEQHAMSAKSVPT